MFCALSRTPGASPRRPQNLNELQSEECFGGRRDKLYFKDAVKGSVHPNDKNNIFSYISWCINMRRFLVLFGQVLRHQADFCLHYNTMKVNVISFVVFKAFKMNISRVINIFSAERKAGYISSILYVH